MSIKGFKGFDKNWKCRDFQYEIGGKYETNKAKACEAGFHLCENPLDVLTYYPLGSKFASVEGDGKIDRHKKDSKVACTKIHILAEISLKDFILSGVKFVFSLVKSSKISSATTGSYAHSATTGDSAHSATTGSFAHSATTGNSAHSATTGDYAHSEVKGKNAIACALGKEGQAKGALGSWIILTEYNNDNSIKTIRTAIVDGNIIKADVFYTLKDCNFVEVE
jgi:hypothetical protein